MSSAFKLTPEQSKAVEHGEGPLLIIAGPGSGKTRVITQRIVHVLSAGGGARQEAGLFSSLQADASGSNPGSGTPTQPENILALTFTEKAAKEMRNRVREAMPGIEELPQISTFHAFCYEVLRKRHFERTLLDKIDVWIFLRQRMESLGLNFYQKLAEPGAFLHSLNDFFSRCQDELIEPEDFEAYVKSLEREHQEMVSALDPEERILLGQELEKKQELAHVFRNSRKLIEEAGSSSLGSLIPETVRLFDQHPEVLESYRQQFRYVLVDEFQDTNYAQVELLKRLVKPPHNITAVGDDDQAIYRFRGASHGAFKMFDDAYPGHETVFLDTNYRSSERILRVAEVLIGRNDRYEAKPKLRAHREEGPPVYLLQSTDYVSEAAWIADEVKRLIKQKTPPGDIAILYRAHNYRNPLVEQFRSKKIPFAIRGLSILSTPILRDLMAYLNVIRSYRENVSLTRVLLAPRWRFPEGLALEARKQALRDRRSIYEVLTEWEKSSDANRLSETGWHELKSLLDEMHKLAVYTPVSKLLEKLLGRLELNFKPHDPDGTYVDAFRKFLEKWEGKSETWELEAFWKYFQYFREAGGQIEAPEPENSARCVQMMSVHAAKGLEFPVVFILSVAPRRFPHSEMKPVIEFPESMRKGPPPPANIHEQEERRLLYVGLTRAEDRLYVSSVTKSGKKPSVFISDLTSDAVVDARDIERVQISETAAEATAPTAEKTAPRAPSISPQPQEGLFESGTSEMAIHPPLAEWAGHTSAISPTEKLQLSASALETYETCPQKFLFGHYLKIPTGPQPALTFGNVMHQCVRQYFELRRKGPVQFEELQAYFEKVWRSAGFEDDYQEQSYKKAGLEQLREFAGRHQDTKTFPIAAEEKFTYDMGDILLEGRIDQINPLPDHSVELIDYKTGRPPSQKDADKSLQLSVYALAARDQLKLKPTKLTFYSLTSNERVSTVRTPKSLELVANEIRGVAELIRKHQFEPKPGFACKFCDFELICPAHEEVY